MKKKLEELEKINLEVLELKVKILKYDVINLEKNHPYWFQFKKNRLFKDEIGKLKLEIMDISMKVNKLLND